MKLNELQKSILISERDYRKIEDKLRFVNIRLDKIGKKQISVSTYYYQLHILESRIKERSKKIAKERLLLLINEFDMLKEDRIEVREMIQYSIKKEKVMAAARLKAMQIEIGQRIVSLAESIYYLSNDSKYHVEQIEDQQIIDEELNEKIRLFSNLT